MNEFSAVIASMHMLLDDSTTPRAVREKLTKMSSYLSGTEDTQRKVATVLSEIEDLSSDVNIPPYVRTQLYGIASQLETINN